MAAKSGNLGQKITTMPTLQEFFHTNFLVKGLRQRNRTEILAVLQQGLPTAEYQAFVEKLS
ncbi:hypothetical protein [Lyngbya aestuarii]|uniref:hypothetical protein n=1 Tax=Lyngbya aestuarii TaxID=118322 RepID=UPI00403DC2A3